MSSDRSPGALPQKREKTVRPAGRTASFSPTPTAPTDTCFVATNFNEVTFVTGGNRLDCAMELCNNIVQALNQDRGVGAVSCTVTDVGGNAVIDMWVPGETLIGGQIDITCKSN
jgi:hypothetical protein